MFYELCLFNVLIGLHGCFYDQNGKQIKPCKTSDEKCRIEVLEKFLVESADGVPKYDIKVIDPIIVPDVEYDVPFDLVFKEHLRNTNVTGIKNLKISKLEWDTTNQRISITSNLKVNIFISDYSAIVPGRPVLKSNMNFIGTDYGKTFSTHVSSHIFICLPQRGRVHVAIETKATTTFQYTIEKRDPGLEYIVPGEETTTFVFDKAPTYTVGDDILERMAADPVFAPKLKRGMEIIDDLIIFTSDVILKNAYVNVIHNIRQFFKILPISSFTSAE